MTAYKQAYGEHYTHEVVPFAEIVLVKVPRQTHRGWSRKRKNAGIKATLCSSKVRGLVELRHQTNTSFSLLEVACFHAQFDDGNRHDDTMLYFSIA